MEYIIQIFSNIIILLLFNLQFINTDIFSPSERLQKINKEDFNSINKSYLEKLNIKSKKRKLQYDQDWFNDLKIYLDLFNFNEKIPNNYKKYKDAFINSMNKAKKTLESLLQIYYLAQNELINRALLESWGLEKWNETLFGDNPQNDLINEEITNVIFFKFASLGDSNMAYSEIVWVDAEYTPNFGVITLNTDIPESKLNEKYLEPLMLHQFTHLLGFHISRLVNDNFPDPEDYIYFYGIIQSNEGTPTKYYLDIDNAPNVINYANKYFGCIGENKISEIILEIDEHDNIHWPSRLLLGEYMTKFIYPEEQVMSGFTLSFFIDLQYLKVKGFYTGGLMRFGKHQGFDFISKKCVNDESGVKFENDFYYPTNFDIIEPSCSSGRLSKTVHKLYKYINGIPSEYQYFTNDFSLYGGLESTNYCPVSVSGSENVYDNLCSEKGKLTDIEKNIFGESHSGHSFCALNTFVKNPNTNYEIYKDKVRAGCFNMYCSEESLTIQVGDDYLVCPKNGGKISSANYNGYILCPDYNLICTAKKTEVNNDLCNDMFDCINNKVEEKEESFTVYYNNIKTTQDSSIYLNQEISNNDCFEQSESDGKCPQFCMQCKKNNRCFICKEGYGLLGKDDNNQAEKIICKEITTLQNGEYYHKEINSYTVYYSCNEKLSHCVKCSNENICTECENKFKIEDNTCVEIVKDCDEYNADDSCKKCKIGFELIKGEETSCMKSEDLNALLNKHYYYEVLDEPKYFVKCSFKIPNCEECDGENNCLKCYNNNDDKKY